MYDGEEIKKKRMLSNRFKATMVRLGEHNTETNPDCENNYCANPVQDIDPVQIIVHKHYNTPLFKHDIALIRLSQPITYNGNSHLDY